MQAWPVPLTRPSDLLRRYRQRPLVPARHFLVPTPHGCALPCRTRRHPISSLKSALISRSEDGSPPLRSDSCMPSARYSRCMRHEASTPPAGRRIVVVGATAPIAERTPVLNLLALAHERQPAPQHYPRRTWTHSTRRWNNTTIRSCAVSRCSWAARLRRGASSPLPRTRRGPSAVTRPCPCAQQCDAALTRRSCHRASHATARSAGR